MSYLVLELLGGIVPKNCNGEINLFTYEVRVEIKIQIYQKVWILWKPKTSKSRQTVVGVTEYWLTN